jgi:hypothetical protein
MGRGGTHRKEGGDRRRLLLTLTGLLILAGAGVWIVILVLSSF